MSDKGYGYVVVSFPESCYGCWLHYENDELGLFCTVTDENVSNYVFRKPEWCPVKKFPEEFIKEMTKDK